MLRKCILVTFFSFINLGVGHAEQPIVLELFTSQGCSSCPPADALLRRLVTEDPSVLPLSFHVDYWDYLGWKDPYSSAASTARQRGYASRLDGQVYTPELVVNGAAGMVGSDESLVRAAITYAHSTKTDIRIATTSHLSHREVVITGGNNNAGVLADVWEVDYRPQVQTQVIRGENRGRILNHINSVTAIKRLGSWRGDVGRYSLPLPSNTKDKVAILVQATDYGPIIGAAIVSP